jgi:hypothetical protein
MRLISDSSECYFLDNRCEWPIKSCDLPVMSAQHRQSRKASRKIAAPRQDFALNLSAKRCLCNTVGGRIGRIVEGCAAYRCAVTAARSRALTMTNFARSSLALVLRAFFGGAKSRALVNIFMICPRWSAGDSPTTTKLRSRSRPSHGHQTQRLPSTQLGTQCWDLGPNAEAKGNDSTHPLSRQGQCRMHRIRFEKRNFKKNPIENTSFFQQRL